MEERHARYLAPNGKLQIVQLNAKGHDMMMKNARALAAGAMIYRHKGKLYVLAGC